MTEAQIASHESNCESDPGFLQGGGGEKEDKEVKEERVADSSLSASSSPVVSDERDEDEYIEQPLSPRRRTPRGNAALYEATRFALLKDALRRGYGMKNGEVVWRSPMY